MRPNLLLQLLSARPRSNRAAGYTMVAGILVILSLLVGTMGLLALVHGSKLAAFFSGQARDGQSVAEAGADQIIATFNQPENRQLLVAGSTPPSQWSTSNPALQSPCVASDGTRPGSNNGLPTQRAVNFADGQFRDLQNVDSIVDVDAPDQAKRSFRLVSVRYSAGVSGNTDRRSIYRTFQANGTALSQAGYIPAGTSFNSLVNLDNPDGGDALNPGTNTGLITLTVEGRLYRADGTTTTSTTTKEFEVVPKCCGGSFGSNGSGGTTTGTPPANSLGADSRMCGLDFGLIVGLNNGRLFSFEANDRFTRTIQTGQVVSLDSIPGLIADPSHGWDRLTSQLVSGSQVGCRTMPSACNIATDTHPLKGSTPLNTEYNQLSGSTGGNGTPLNCPQRDAGGTSLHPYGNRSSVAGSSASCVPITPLYFQSPGLPSIQSNYTYPWRQTTDVNINPLSRSPYNVTQTSINHANNFLVAAGYPRIRLTNIGDTSINKIWIRANASWCNLLEAPSSQCSSGLGTVLEYCNTKYLPNNRCASIYDQENPSQIHTWAVISQPGLVSNGYGISDDFRSYTNITEFTSKGGKTWGSIPRWPSLWTLSQQANIQIPRVENVTQGIKFYFSGTGTASWGGNLGTDTRAPAIARAINLYGLLNPVFSIVYRQQNVSSYNTNNYSLRIDYSYNTTSGETTDSSIVTNVGWTELGSLDGLGDIRRNNTSIGNCSQAEAGLYAKTWQCNLLIPPEVLAPRNLHSHFVKFRVRAASNYSNVGVSGQQPIKEVVVNRIAITSDASSNTPTQSSAQNAMPNRAFYQNWCENPNHQLSVSNTDILTPFLGGMHCLGPFIDLSGVGKTLYVDTTDSPISFYYNSPNDFRGTDMWQPLIRLNAEASIRHVSCSRADQTSTAPRENCEQEVGASAFGPVGAYGKLNFFGRHTAPDANCKDSGLTAQPCNQFITIDTYSYGGSRSGIFGAWLYFPWGHLAFCGATCRGYSPVGGGLLPVAAFNSDHSFNFYGRLWVRSLSSGGQAHLRIPASPSSSLSSLSLAGAINWTGIDWVARSTTATRQRYALN